MFQKNSTMRRSQILGQTTAQPKNNSDLKPRFALPFRKNGILRYILTDLYIPPTSFNNAKYPKINHVV